MTNETAAKAGPSAGDILAGNRRALARAITLAESSRPDHRARAETLLAELLPATGKAIRVGLSGPPGVGKSTFIESFGGYLTGKGRKVAVLAVDPSSARSGGSILGDKTRMETLARDPNAFIRPTPSGGTLGGVARRTRDAMLLCEAAGFDVVLIETVGVGQSEVAVADLTDMFLLLVGPGGGDELQGIKRGIMELADLVVVTKADGDLLPAARLAAADYGGALHLIRPKSAHWTAEVILTSAMANQGLAEVWDAIGRHHRALTDSGELASLRAGQLSAAFWTSVREGLLGALLNEPDAKSLAARLEADVSAGKLTPAAAARLLLQRPS